MAAVAGAQKGKLSERGEQPSLFDVIAQESLTTSLKPALSHLLKFLAAVYPHRWSLAHKWSDELYTAFDLLLQNHYLKNYGGSFAENFYGLKRVLFSTGRQPNFGFSRLRSLLVLVAWPYIRGKLDRMHERLSEQLQFLHPRPTEPAKLRLSRLFVRLWPWLKSILSAISFFLQITYTTNFTQTHSVHLLLSGARLERLTPADLSAFSALPVHLQQSGLLPRLWRFLLSIPGWCSRLFGYALFFVQFIDLLYNSELGGQLARKDWRVPAAPHKMLREDEVFTLEVSKCPICLSRRQNDTALSVSGYVFCFACIDGHVRREGRCPLTGLPASPSNLIRLYITANAF